MSHALIVFIKNPLLGKVKTRLAKTAGAEKALEVYQALLRHTRAVCEVVHAETFVFYHDFINKTDEWQKFSRRLQTGNDLGEKMSNAFAEIFASGNSRVVIIGSDCMEISPAIIQDAFDSLHQHDVVIGPAADGGYYLLGMKQVHPQLFMNKTWSTETVLQQTVADVMVLNLSYKLLPVLHDIDEEKDLDNVDFPLV